MAFSFIKYLLCCQETFPCLLLSDAVNTSHFMWTHLWLNVENFGWSVTPDFKHILDMWTSLHSTGPCSLTLIRLYLLCLLKRRLCIFFFFWGPDVVTRLYGRQLPITRRWSPQTRLGMVQVCKKCSCGRHKNCWFHAWKWHPTRSL